MSVIRYTHSFDLLYQVVVIVVTVNLVYITFEVLSLIPLVKWLTMVGLPEWIYGVLQVVALLLLMPFWAIILFSISAPLPTYLYLRFTLSVPVTWREAKAVSFLFEKDLNGKWYPLKDLKKAPKEARKMILFDFAERKRQGLR